MEKGLIQNVPFIKIFHFKSFSNLFIYLHGTVKNRFMDKIKHSMYGKCFHVHYPFSCYRTTDSFCFDNLFSTNERIPYCINIRYIYLTVLPYNICKPYTHCNGKNKQW